MSALYELIPLDTLFFRGSQPMEAGQNVGEPLFPPPVSVFAGAFRTAVLEQSGVSLADYKAGKDKGLEEKIGCFGSDEIPFAITKILLRKDGHLYAKVPAVWYADSAVENENTNYFTGSKIIAASYRREEFNALGILSSAGEIPYVVPTEKEFSLANFWIRMDFLFSNKAEIQRGDLIPSSELYCTEERTGNALDLSRKTVEEGKLYTARHIRLNPGVSLVVELNKDIGLANSGILHLGGERRVCNYTLLKDALPTNGDENSAEQYFCLAPIKATGENAEHLVASGKLSVTAGWDLAKGFHKPSATWFPAGSVFDSNIQGICVPLALKK